MNKELHSLLVEIENKFEMELDDYFKLDEKSKEELSLDVVEYFMPYIESKPYALTNVIQALKVMIDEAEYYEKYEKADFLNRCRVKYKRLTFS